MYLIRNFKRAYRNKKCWKVAIWNLSGSEEKGKLFHNAKTNVGVKKKMEILV